MNLLDQAIGLRGWAPLAKALGVSEQAVRKWRDAGRLPRSEFSGETKYAEVIDTETGGMVRASDLIEWSRRGWNAKAA